MGNRFVVAVEERLKMKLSLLQQGRRSNSFRGQSGLDSSVDGAGKSPGAIFWLVLHALCCLISLVLGFRFSRLVFFLLVSSSATSNFYVPMAFRGAAGGGAAEILVVQPTPVSSANSESNGTVASTSRVVVGRHGIAIRQWPHPNPAEVMKAHRIIERVQMEQRRYYGVKSPRTVIAVTPTYVRTFQTLHLTGVMHSLMNVPHDLIWIVVEAGGATNETAALLSKSGLRIIHIGFNRKMPITWEDRHKMESQMRIQALRVVREKKLEGIIMFADDSNMHSLELFDEIQKVKWIGAVSVGILAHSGGFSDEGSSDSDNENKSSVPIQGPACNSSDQLIGWHTINTLPFIDKTAKYIGDRAIVLPRKMEWSELVLNSRLFWEEREEEDEEDKPSIDLETFDKDDFEHPLSLFKDSPTVEPLGNCGRKVMLWWLRVEARSDSKFPSGWIIDPPLEVTVPARKTSWPEAPPELPSDQRKTVVVVPENTEKRSGKTRSTRSKRRSKRRRDPQVSSSRSTEN